jgi:hypothetical protein
MAGACPLCHVEAVRIGRPQEAIPAASLCSAVPALKPAFRLLEEITG